MNDALILLANHGIEVGADNKLLQDRSVQLYPDGHLHDFGRGGQHYKSAKEFIAERTDLHGAPVQATSRSSGALATKAYDVTNIYNTFKNQYSQLGEPFKSKALHELLPANFWRDGVPDGIGYSFHDNSLTVSVDDDSEVKAVTIRRSLFNGSSVKWKTLGQKTFIATRLTGKDKVYLASGMGEIVLMELMGWDYIGLQSDGMVNHLQNYPDIKQLIILPDNDSSFIDKIPAILQAIQPAEASIYKSEYFDPREAAIALKTREKLQVHIDTNLLPLEIPEPMTLMSIVKEERAVVSVESPVPTEIFRSAMSDHWENNLKQVKADGMDDNWVLLANTMNSIIKANQDGEKSTAYIIPLATGESKTQSSIVYTALLNKTTDVKAMIVVRLNEDAEMDANQINALGGDAVAFNSKSTITIDEASSHKTVIVSHEFFKRNGYANNEKWQTLADDRDLFIIDEALHSVNSITLDKLDLTYLRSTANQLKEKVAVRIIDDYLELIRKLASGEFAVKGFAMTSSADSSMPYDDELLAEVYTQDESGLSQDEIGNLYSRANVRFMNTMSMDRLVVKMKSTPMIEAVSCKSRKLKQHSLESFYRKTDIEKAEGLSAILGTGSFATRKTGSITGVKELMPNGVSFVVLDATAPINAIYSLQSQYKGNLNIVPVKCTRNYKGFEIKTARTATGASSLTQESIQGMLDNIALELEDTDKLFIVTHKSTKPLWTESP